MMLLLRDGHKAGGIGHSKQARGSILARLRLHVDEEHDTLHVQAIGSTLHGIELAAEPKWNAGQVRFALGAETPVKSLMDGTVILELQGVETVRIRMDKTLSWEGKIQPSAYQLVWVGNGRRTIAAFRIQLPDPGRD